MHKKWLFMMKSKLFFILSLFYALSSCACSQEAGKDAPPAEPGNFVRMADGVLVQTQLLPASVPISVLLPKSYLKEPDRRYPVVYMLHGLGDTPESWNDTWLRVQSTIESLEENGLSDMIYIFPSGYRSYYCNRFDGGFPYMDMFIQELIPFVDKAYRTIADKEHRAISGYSMGGFGACALALKHPEMFCASAPLSMSFRTDHQYMTEEQSGWNSQWGRIFGGSGQTGAARITDYYKEHCPFYQFVPENKQALSTVHWYFTCGDNEEQLLIAGDNLHAQMRDAGIPHEYRVGEGGHEGSYWRSALREVLPMFDYYMTGASSLWEPHAQKARLTPLAYENAFVSKEYKSGSGTLTLLVHNGLGKDQIGKIMAAMDKSDYNKAFVLYPCDLAVKSLSTWMSEASQAYPSSKLICITVGTDGTPALSLAEHFERTLFIDSSFSEAPSVKKGQKIYYSATDDAPNYKGMNALYNASKAAEAEFEYRVLNSTGDRAEDWIISIQSLITHIIY